MKDTQVRYKNDLEEQKEDIRRKVLENQMRDAELENDVAKFQRAKAELKTATEDARVKRLRNDMIKKQQEGLADADRMRK